MNIPPSHTRPIAVTLLALGLLLMAAVKLRSVSATADLKTSSSEISRTNPLSRGSNGSATANVLHLHSEEKSARSIDLKDEPPIKTNYIGDEKAVRTLAGARPLSLVSGDFDSDGVQDLVAGYAAAGGGEIVLYRGNADAFAPQSDASFNAIGRGEFSAPFLGDARVFNIPVSPDFVAVGNFTGSGENDLVVASRQSNRLYVFASDGKGNFSEPQIVDLPGNVTTLASGEFGTGMNAANLVIGVDSDQGSSLLVCRVGKVDSPVIYPLKSAASKIVLGDLDGDLSSDAAILAGGQVSILRSAGMDLEEIPSLAKMSDIALGSYIADRNHWLQIALITASGNVSIAVQSGFDPRALTVAEFAKLRKDTLRGTSRPLPVKNVENTWHIEETFPLIAQPVAVKSRLMLTTRISSNSADDLMILDGTSNQMTVISHPDQGPDAQTYEPGEISTKAIGDQPLAALPVRVNIDGRMGLIALVSGKTEPVIMAPLAVNNYTVTGFADTTPVPACTGVSPNISCPTLRGAVLAANANAGTDTITLPAGTYTLTIAKVAGNYTGNFGALYINDSVNIVGAAQNTTFIQAGTIGFNPGPANGVDMVMAVNEDISPITAATASISNLTMQNGHNRGTHGNDGDGGCMEFDTGTSGTANLTLMNITLQNCDTTQGNGAGLANFNFVVNGAGLATITNSTIQNNKGLDPTGGGGASAGGIWVSNPSRILMTNGQVLNNIVTEVNGVGGRGIGGGIRINANGTTRQTVIHSSTISGNQASGPGGGIWSDSDLIIDQSTVINGNAAGANGGGAQDGGGLFYNSQPAQSATLTKVVITGNTATGRGGAIASGNLSGGGPLTMNFCRLNGNTATGTGSNFENLGSTISATEDWWGTNSAAGTIHTTSGTTTFSPFIVLTHTPVTNPIVTGQATTLTASFLTDSASGNVGLANLDLLLGLPITINNPVKGNLSGVQATIQASGTATSTFTASAAGAGSADAKVDNQTTTAAITINKASTTSAITNNPAATVVGQGYAVNFSVAVTAPGSAAPTAPTGNVTVSDGSQTCLGAINAGGTGTCTLTSTSAGAKTLTATYAGDANFNASPASPGVAHTVNKADTTSAVNSDTPDPTVFGQNYTVNATVTVNVPGTGATTGSIGVSDGTNTCTITLPATTCSLPSTSPGAKTITATYNGDTNFNVSPGATASHTVNQGSTTASVVSSVNPSITGQSVTFTATVTAVAPSVGTPTGTVQFVVDGVNFGAPVATVAGVATTTTSGLSAAIHPVSANYSGDINFAVGSGALAGGQNVSNTATWSGASNTAWATAANWTTGATPAAINDVSIPAAGVTNEPTISTAVSVGNITESAGRTLTITAGNSLTASGTCTINGTMNVAGSYTCGTFTGTGTVNFTGAAAQNIPSATYQNLGVTNAAGVTLGGNSTVNGTLTMNGGNLNTGANTLTIGTGGSVTRTSGVILGNIAKQFGATGSFTYPVGTPTGFSPVTANVTALAINPSTLQVKANDGTAPAVPPLQDTTTLNRFWTLTETGDLTANVTFNYLQADVRGVEGNYRTIVVSGTNANLLGNVGACPGAGQVCVDPTANTIFVGGLTTFSNWTAGELAPVAAGVDVGGQVLISNGRGAPFARVAITDLRGNTVYAITNPFGYFRFTGIQAGGSYTVSVNSKYGTYQPRIITVNEEILDLNFFPVP